MKIRRTYWIALIFWCCIVLLSSLVYIHRSGWMTIIRQQAEIPTAAIKHETSVGPYLFKIQLSALEKRPLEQVWIRVQLLENGMPLIYPNAQPRSIGNKGMGRYAILNQALHFSASDNSSPVRNNKQYRLTWPLWIGNGVAWGIYLATFLVTVAMLWFFPTFRKPFALAAFNVALLVGLCYAFETYLRLTEPVIEENDNGVITRHKLPYDSNYANINPIYYEGYKEPNLHSIKEFTWGIPVIKNHLGFREKDFEIPKPAAMCRIMVLGDSLTWGAGLRPEERYSNILEQLLRKDFPQKNIEVLNFGLRGGATVKERDILRENKDRVQPDLIVVGFCKNDTQPRSEDYSTEKADFDHRFGPFLDTLAKGLKNIGLPRTGYTIRAAFENFAGRIGALPSGDIRLQRTYNRGSQDWKLFVQALQDIKGMSDEMHLPAPLFAVLNQAILTNAPTDYHDMSETYPL